MKSHYEERLDHDLDEIRGKVREVSTLIEDQVRDAVHALLEDDRDLANQVILGDRRVNRRVKEIDHLCHAFIVRYAPSAGPLRFVSAALRLHVALERIGDYAGMIGREAVQMTQLAPGRVARDIELISQQARRTLNQALTAFNDEDEELARSTLGLPSQADATFQKVHNEILRAGEKGKAPIPDIVSLTRILNLIMRVAEQAQNICEQAIFAMTGETRDPKIFRILFVDKKNSLASPMAMAYAQQAYPESGVYSSAGWKPAEELAPGLVEFMEQKGANLHEVRPTELRPVEEEPQHYHVIVGLSTRAERYFEEIPFRTVFLTWNLEEVEMPDEPTTEDYERIYRVLAPMVQELMHTLRGRDAR